MCVRANNCAKSEKSEVFFERARDYLAEISDIIARSAFAELLSIVQWQTFAAVRAIHIVI